MEHILKRDLYQALLTIENDRSKQGLFPGYRFPGRYVSRKELVEKALSVFNILRCTPYRCAQEVGRLSGTDRDVLAVLYKMIQRSSVCLENFIHSENPDYFTVLRHYFNQNFYTVVFFVGLDCPSRCIYCPSVSVDRSGKRRIKKYSADCAVKLDKNSWEQIFDDIAAIKDSGTMVMIKISGGLEPLTDIGTMKWIIRFSDELEIPVKLFSNGLLFNDPEKRKVALGTDDIRISLSTTDDDQYQYLCFSHEKTTPDKKRLPCLKENIHLLVRDRLRFNPECKIGFNSIVRPENHTSMIPLMQMARDLGVDYIDFKPDYFSRYDAAVSSAIGQSLQEARTWVGAGTSAALFVNFCGALSDSHLYWQSWSGTCNPVRQSDFKIFITPFGQCSPVHYGAFPHGGSANDEVPLCYSIGEIGDHCGLIDILSHPAAVPDIDLRKLNPFELLLSLELAREEADMVWGLPLSVSPYHICQSDQLQPELFFPFKITGD